METILFKNLVDYISSFSTKGQIADFLSAILTPKELKEIPKRLEIVKLLKSGVAQRQIAQKLDVGIATVTRGSREIQKGNFKNIKYNS